MAPGMKWWFVALLGGWGLVAVAFLPPRATPAQSDFDMWTPWYWATTPERRRVAQLAWQWRAAQHAFLAASYSDSVARWLVRRPDAGRRPVLVTATAVPPHDRAAFWAWLDSAAARVRPTSEIALGVVIVPDTLPAEAGRPRGRWSRSPMYLTPAETGRPACVVLLPYSRSRSRVPGRVNPLGPCTYYAAFGRPGRAIERWLRHRRFDFAYAVDWATDVPTLSRSVYQELAALPPSVLRRHVMGAPLDAVACLGGRADACRAEVLRTPGRAPWDPGAIVATEGWQRDRTIEGAFWFLSDLIREHGRERFGRFWRSELPVDSAFAAAFGVPLGEWTARWQRTMLPRLPLGPAAGMPAAGLALVLAGLAIAATLVYASRRQVA